jgi:hypothetical protein
MEFKQWVPVVSYAYWIGMVFEQWVMISYAVYSTHVESVTLLSLKNA